MTDLAQSIVDMTAAAKGRKIARAELDAATERIAQAIVGPFRSGDSVTIYRILAHGDALDGAGRGGRWTASPPDDTQVLVEPVTVSVERITWDIPYTTRDGLKASKPDEHGCNALVINNVVYSDPRPVGSGRRVGRHAHIGVTSPLYDLHMATGEERLRFCKMAPAIVEAFRRLAEVQAEEYAKGAEAVSRTVVR